MPKELICDAPGKLRWNEYDEPALTGRQVRIRGRHGAAKHGTELASFKGYAAQRGPYDAVHGVWTYAPTGEARGGMVGNMVVGEVVEVGPEVEALAAGDRVLAHGGFRQTHVCDERRCWKLPAELSWKSAVCLDPADFALGAVRDGQVRVGDAVAVLGIGAIGLMAVQLAVAGGASIVIVSDPLPNRRVVAERLGADVALDPSTCDVGLEIRKATGNRGADVVIEYSGTAAAMQAALRGVAFGGNVVAGAFPPPYAAGLDLGAEAHRHIPNIVFTRSCSEPNRDHPRWDEQRLLATCMKMLVEGTIGGEEIVTPVVPFDDLLTEYPRIATEPDTYIKLGTEYP